jgi:hypothetical protein
MKAALAISLALFVMSAQMLSLHFQSQVPPGSTSSAPTSNPTLASTIKDHHTAFTSVGLVIVAELDENIGGPQQCFKFFYGS